MLIIVMDEQILFPKQICQTCLFADQGGQPRWRQGRLRCGHAIQKVTDNQPEQYECQMGFRLMNVE